MLTVLHLQVICGRAVTALCDVSLRVDAGAVVARLDPNGAGKSTRLKAPSAILRPEDGEIVGGSITLGTGRARR